MHTEQAHPRHPSKLTQAAIPIWWKDFLSDESGQDLIEYVLFAALVALGVITAARGLGTSIASAFGSLASNMTSNT